MLRTFGRTFVCFKLYIYTIRQSPGSKDVESAVDCSVITRSSFCEDQSQRHKSVTPGAARGKNGDILPHASVLVPRTRVNTLTR